MVENFVGPSELHLKKELIALQNSPLLRDPKTCSSWRSPLSSRSVASISHSNYRNGFKSNAAAEIKSGESLEIPPGREKRRKKVYLYNWGHHSSKFSDSEMKLDVENRQVSVERSPKDTLQNRGKLDYRSDTLFQNPMTSYGTGGSNPGTPVRQTARILRRRAVGRRRETKNSPQRLNVQSGFLEVLESFEQSDDTVYCSSNDFQQSRHDLAEKGCYFSRCASPLSTSGCRKWSRNSKIFRSARRGNSSHSGTPVSPRSYSRHEGQKPYTVQSKDDSSASVYGDEEDHNRYGIPYQWTKRMRDWSCGGCYSPSLSDPLRRKGGSILCGRQTISHKQKHLLCYSHDLPLLTSSCHRSGSSQDSASDETSTNLELELEASSRLDGSRWPSCKSQGAEFTTLGGDGTQMLNRSLSHKYMPRSFDEIVGHDIVVQSLSNSISRKRIAPAYLFHGPRGTGKSLTARIFAAALNCLSTEENKPCGFCRECNIRNVSTMRELNATNKKDIDRVKYMLQNISPAKIFSPYRVFVIDECHKLSTKMWSAFMKFLEEQPSHVVFVFITTNPDDLSCTIMSCCQKYSFPKIKDADIVCRLRKLSDGENLDVELDALDLIALNSEGSLRDAEMMLDQLSLLGKKITTSLVNDLPGIVSNEKLIDLLETAMSSDTAETVRRSRKLLDSGVDPVALMSQIAGLIMDVIAGTNQLVNSKCQVTESKLEKLQQALKILSDAEKQLRHSSERSTWFTAALLQLGSGRNLEYTHSSRRSIKKRSEKDNECSHKILKGASTRENKSSPLLRLKESSSTSIPEVTSRHSNAQELSSSEWSMREILATEKLPTSNMHVDRSLMDAAHKTDATSNKVDTGGNKIFRCIRPENLDEIWRRCIEKCHSETLKQLLYAHGKLMSITETEGVLTAFIAFGDGSIKSRAEGFLTSITNSIRIVLRHNVEVRIGLIPENYLKALDSVSDSPATKHADIIAILDKDEKEEFDNVYGSSDKERDKGSSELPRKSVYYSEGRVQKSLDNCDMSSLADEDFQTTLPSKENRGACDRKERGKQNVLQWTHESTISEHRSVAETNVLGLTGHSKPEKHHFLPQIGVTGLYPKDSSLALSVSSKLWEDDTLNEIQELKISDSQGSYKQQFGKKVDQYAMSPSLLHSNSFGANFDRENLDYDSGIGRSGLPCWKNSKLPRGQVRQVTRVGSQKGGCLPCFGHCGKLKAKDRRLR